MRQKIPLVGSDGVWNIITHFASQFVSTADLEIYREMFEDSWDLRNGRTVPFDMVSKYCQQRLRDAFVAGLLENKQGLRLPSTRKAEFVDFFFATDELDAWRTSYAGGTSAKRARVE